MNSPPHPAPPATSYFTRIEIKNVKTFEDQALSFVLKSGKLAQWTLLLGDNGVGKTTLLQFLAQMCPDETRPWNGHQLRDSDRASESTVKTNYPFFPKIFTTQEGIKLDGREFKRVKSNYKETPYCKVCFTNQKIGEIIPNGLDDKGNYGDVKFGGPGVSVDTISVINWKYMCAQPFGYGAFRRLGFATYASTIKQDPCATLFDDECQLVNLDELIRQVDYALAKSKTIINKRNFESIKTLLKKILPDVDDIRVPVQGANVKGPEALTPDGWVPIRALSTGYRATMAWVADFAARMLSRYPESENPFAEPAIVLIDQIDTHLHPKWQQKLISDLSSLFPATQFIVTAHSPLMVLAMPDANIAVLKRGENGVQICQNFEDVQGWRIDQIVASDLFEGQPVRDTKTQKKLAERKTLLLKTNLTPIQKERLSTLNEWALELPTADNPTEIRAMDIIRRAAEKIEKSKK